MKIDKKRRNKPVKCCAQSLKKPTFDELLQSKIPHSSNVSRMAVILKEISLGNSLDTCLKIGGLVLVFGISDLKLF